MLFEPLAQCGRQVGKGVEIMRKTRGVGMPAHGHNFGARLALLDQVAIRAGPLPEIEGGDEVMFARGGHERLT
jgi:hypothetical protein